MAKPTTASGKPSSIRGPDDDGDDMPSQETLPAGATVTNNTTTPTPRLPDKLPNKNPQRFRNGILCVKCGRINTPHIVGEVANVRVYNCRMCGTWQVVTYMLDGWPVDSRKHLESTLWRPATKYLEGQIVTPPGLKAPDAISLRCCKEGKSGDEAPHWPTMAITRFIGDGTVEWSVFRVDATAYERNKVRRYNPRTDVALLFDRYKPVTVVRKG
jgi:hypothetical protein